MFRARCSARTTWFPLPTAPSGRRAKATKPPVAQSVKAKVPALRGRDRYKAGANLAAKQLKALGAWEWGKRRRKLAGGADGSRINIVSEELCDDVIKYIKPTLQRHVGCDIVELFPGVGTWSKKLHEALQPRSHLLLEPDAELYTPFLQPLLEKPGVRMIKKSGIAWKELQDVLTPEFLPHQTPHTDPNSQPQRNDTLLVTAILAWHPKKGFANFVSVAHLVLYQLLNAVRTNHLFQKYGLVRMLVWISDDDKGPTLPRVVQTRHRMAIDCEMATEWAVEVAGNDNLANLVGGKRDWWKRDHAIDLESARNTLRRMRAGGFELIPGRETKLMKEVLAMGEENVPTSGAQAAKNSNKFRETLESMEAAAERGEIERGSVDYKYMTNLKSRVKNMDSRREEYHELMRQYDEVVALYDAATDEASLALARQADEEWNKNVGALNKDRRLDFALIRDNLQVFRQDPPVLSWDRRYVDPMVVRPEEFFPNVPCALLDFQPRAMHPLVHERLPGVDPDLVAQLQAKGGPDVLQTLLKKLTLSGSNGSVRTALEAMSPGLANMLLPHIPSLRERKMGGSPVSGFGEVAARTFNERQLVELLETYIRSPHSPVLSELVFGEPLLSEYDEGDDLPDGMS